MARGASPTSVVVKTNFCQNYTSTAHSPQRTVKTLTQVEAKVEDGDCETRREDGDLPCLNSNPCVIIGH